MYVILYTFYGCILCLSAGQHTHVCYCLFLQVTSVVNGGMTNSPGLQNNSHSVLPTGTNTPEYLTMVQCTSQLTTLFKHDLSSISDHLWAQGMMSEDVRGELSESSHTRSFKATLLVNTLTERVKDFPSDYHKFVKIVKKLGPWARDMAEHLDQTYTKGNMSLCKPLLFTVASEYAYRVSIAS